jgi:hypothetical protein
MDILLLMSSEFRATAGSYSTFCPVEMRRTMENTNQEADVKPHKCKTDILSGRVITAARSRPFYINSQVQN